MKRLVIIDGNAILHRAYHALPPLSNKKGEFINAVYGFAAMLLKVINDLKPQYLTVVFDAPGPTFRNEIFKEYQAKRPKMEENLVSQIDKVHQLVKNLSIPIYSLSGFEADDLIGTIVKQVDSNFEKIIVSADHDILQLVDQQTKVYMPVKGLSNLVIYDEKKVFEKYGLKPWQIVDFKALTGDSSDNYPGVPGIGPKTAQYLLANYQTLEDLYQSIKKKHFSAKISDKIVNLLLNNQNQAYLSKKLATIICSTPIDFELKKAYWHQDRDKIVQVFLDVGFVSLAKRVAENKNKQIDKEQNQEQQLGLF